MSENWYGPRIKQIGNYLNDQYASGEFPLGIVNLEGLAVASPAQTPLLADRDPVLQEICVGMSGVETQVKTVNGVPPLLITDAIDCRAFNCAVSYEPQQDLHGYEAPWPAGGGKNKSSIESLDYDRGWWGTNSFEMVNVLNTLPAGDYTIGVTYKITSLGNLTSVQRQGPHIKVGEDSLTPYRSSGTDASPTVGKTYREVSDFTITSAQVGNITHCYFYFGAPNYGTFTGTVGEITIETGTSTTSTYSPYSNICPITGWTGCEVYAEESYDPSATPKASVSFDHTVYGGTADVVLGSGSRAYASYTFTGSEVFTQQAGQDKYYTTSPLSGRFLTDPKCPPTNSTSIPIKTSIGDYNVAYNVLQTTVLSMCISQDARVCISGDLYRLYNGNLSGVQLVYELATPTTYTFTPAPLDLAKGDNYIWSDTNGNDISVTYVAEK